MKHSTLILFISCLLQISISQTAEHSPVDTTTSPYRPGAAQQASGDIPPRPQTRREVRQEVLMECPELPAQEALQIVAQLRSATAAAAACVATTAGHKPATADAATSTPYHPSSLLQRQPEALLQLDEFSDDDLQGIVFLVRGIESRPPKRLQPRDNCE